MEFVPERLTPDDGHGYTMGPVVAIRTPDEVQVDAATFRVTDPALLHSVEVGMSVNVMWTYVNGHRKVQRIEQQRTI
jgi:hypothetical protein